MILIFPSLKTRLNEQFLTEKELKTGPRSSVHLVRDRATKTRYIRREFTGNSGVYRLLQDITCPHLPQIEAVAEEDGRVLVLEEYIQGDTLAFLMKNGPIEPAHAERITLQLCTALDALHKLGVVHRDIKPENVLLRGDEAVLIDFDASRLCKGSRSTDTQVMGTAGYAAPEQYGFAQTDARADIYALGVLFNEMLTGQHPSTRLTAGKYLPIVSKCIETNVDRRYASVQELAAALRQLSAAPTKPKRISAAGILISILAVCLLVGGAYFAFYHHPAEANTSAPQATVLQFEDKTWPHEPQGYTAPFEYDLDGDGETESYLFGITCSNEYLYGLVLSNERIGLGQQDVSRRDPIPCIWRILPDGSTEVEEAFIPLMTDVSLDVWHSNNAAAPMPEYGPLVDAKWPGGLMISFTYEHLGFWITEAKATIGGLELHAASSCLYVDISEFQK